MDPILAQFHGQGEHNDTVATVEAPKRKRRAKAKPVRGGKRTGAGRPARFEGAELKEVVNLITSHGLTDTRAILAANGRSKLSKQRDLKVFPKPVSVSMPTLGTIASEAGIQLFRGRKAA